MEQLDVIVVGAGISGIAAAHYLQEQCPCKSFAILESRAALGGTWDLFRYPGIRSDSDIFSFAYSFKPWAGDETIAGAPAILDYLQHTAAQAGIDQKIRYGHRLVKADWDSATARWTVEVSCEGDTPQTLSCRFLFMCTGYYSYAEAHRPEFPGQESFSGPVVHPQFWPEGLDYRGKRVIVIGSGATAVTLVPAMAAEAAHVTMLQRSPTWVVARPARDRIALWLRALLPQRLAYRLARLKFITRDMLFFNVAMALPAATRAVLLCLLRLELGRKTVAEHFTPAYRPWRQRICLVPDGDLFASLRSGKASVETAVIDRFTASGIRLRSGVELPADIIVSATGLKMEIMSGVALTVDGAPVALGDTLAYKGCMYSGIPNLASSFGYSNASWTLKAELICEYVCRVLLHMDRSGQPVCTPQPQGVRALDAGPMNLASGYVLRALQRLPKQGDRHPWRTRHNYALDILALRHGRLEDGALVFSGAGLSAAARDAARIATRSA